MTIKIVVNIGFGESVEEKVKDIAKLGEELKKDYPGIEIYAEVTAG